MFYVGESGSILGSVARIWFAHPGKGSYSSTCCCDELKSSKRKHAVVAQLVEHHLAKVDVASSSLVNRSTQAPRFASGLFVVSRSFSVPGSFSFRKWGRRAGVLRSFSGVTALGSLLLGGQCGEKKSSKILGCKACGGEAETALRVLLKLL